MKYTIATATHVGRIREGNEDAVYPEDDAVSAGPIVVAVADGMGGHAAGEVASALAIEGATATEGATAAERVVAANDAVLSAAQADPALAGMGTTLTLAILWPDGRLEIGHVGTAGHTCGATSDSPSSRSITRSSAS